MCRKQKRKMEDKQREYNQLSEIDTSNYGVEFIPFYRDRYRDVANVKIDEAKNKVERQSEKLRDVFLHDFVAELNEKIISAKEEIAAINAELKRIPFGRDIYQFKMEEKTDRQIFFTICKNLELYSESPDLFTERTVSDEKLADDGYFVCSFDTAQKHRAQIYSKHRRFFAHIIYFFDFIWHRVCPKMGLTRRFYYFCTKKVRKVFPRPEILGRLYYCGFDVVCEQYVHDRYMVIGQKKRPPCRDPHTYGPFIKLRRVGKDGELFNVYKFRTMYAYSEFLQTYIYNNNSLDAGGKFHDD